MFWERLVVSNHERLLLTRKGRFDRILLPGTYRIGPLHARTIGSERHDTRKLVFRSVWSDYLRRERRDLVEQHFTTVSTLDTEVAMVYADEELFRVLPPRRTLLLWRGIADIRAEIVRVVEETSEALLIKR